MRNFEDFVDGLNRDTTIPDLVNHRIDETLQRLDSRESKKGFHVSKIAVSAACVLLAFGVLFVSNFAAASDLPIIGDIFKKVQNQIIYSGDYSNKKMVIADKNKSATEIVDKSKATIYSAQDQDIKLTVSEVYSDGFSIFATMKMESRKYDFSKTEVLQNGTQAINLAVSYGVNQDIDPYDYDLLLDGRNEGKNAFIGVVKFDKAETSAENGNVNILVRNISIFDEEEEEENIKGEWKLKIPYETDRENIREIPIQEKTDAGLSIEKLFLSPYQMVVFSKTPENNTFYETAAFDQDGKKIRFEEIGDKPGEFASEIFSLRGREVSKVHIYVTQNEENMIKMHLAETEAEARKLAEKDFWVDIPN